ncbi:MAG: gliding motility-associated C-terminal domain-containing protein [Bacteroidetes bacterium]|nr:MAG: gliding motility-associated C-terminal domain-containing protein [Bacteroidota bacterium]
MKTLRNLIGLTALLLSFNMTASHIIGGDVYYEYVGNQPGRQVGDYKITMVIYRESTGIPLNSPLSTSAIALRIEAVNCNYSFNLTMPRVGNEFSAGALGAFDCIDSTDLSPTQRIPKPTVNKFEQIVNLAGTSCNNFIMYFHGNARPNNYTNVPNGDDFYFEAGLDKRNGHNTSPIFLNSPVNYACSGSYQIYQQYAIEPDGDSIRYELIQPRNTAARTINYLPSWSHTRPVSVDDTNGPFTLDPNTGTLTFLPMLPPGVQYEVSTFAIGVYEYRFDSTYQVWDEVGYTTREIQIVVRAQCLPIVNQGVKLDASMQGTYLDSLGRQVRDYNCGDTSVTLSFTLPIECFSVSPDGTDFRITAPNGQPLPVKTARTYCDNNAETDSITVVLYKPLVFNGDYYLYTKFGSDGNTLLNKCGKAMNEFDTIILRVEGCIDPVYDMENVSVNNDQVTQVEWSVDTNTIAGSYIDFVRVQRSDDNGLTFNQVGVTGYNASPFIDFGVNGNLVDAQSFDYRLEFVILGQAVPVTRSIASIHLVGAYNAPMAQVPMRWTHYDGWGAPSYTVELGEPTGTLGQYNWSLVNDASLPTTDTFYTYNTSSLNAGQTYALRVQTTDGNYVSESNWIVFSTPTDPPVQGVSLTVPNVFTPDMDAINQRWTIAGIDSYEQVEVSIFDRWGHQVYSSNNYSNDRAWDGKTSNGRDVSEGTYFYVVHAINGPDGSSVEEHGSITVMRGDQ